MNYYCIRRHFICDIMKFSSTIVKVSSFYLLSTIEDIPTEMKREELVCLFVTELLTK